MTTYSVIECDGCGRKRELKPPGWAPDEAQTWRVVRVHQVSGQPLAEVNLCSDCTVMITGPGGVKKVEVPAT